MDVTAPFLTQKTAFLLKVYRFFDFLNLYGGEQNKQHFYDRRHHTNLKIKKTVDL
jgi:hypothetical protein